MPGFPVPVIIMIVLVAIAWITLLMTKFGRHTYAIGGNEECARLSGIKVDRAKIAVYAISGASAAITGILLTMRLASSQPTLGDGLELDAIAAVVLGGTSLFWRQGIYFGHDTRRTVFNRAWQRPEYYEHQLVLAAVLKGNYPGDRGKPV